MATYYVNARSGSDKSDGLTPGTAWRSIDEVNNHSFQPGDQILFQRGDVFTGTLDPRSSGDSGNPVTFGAYGSGDNPVLRGSGDTEVVRIDGVDHIRLENVDVTGGKRGVSLEGTNGSELIDVNVYGNNRDGIYIGNDSHHNLVQGGSAHDNGEVDAKYHEPYGRWINLGHGVLVNGGAHDNTIENVELYANAEDGLQFGNSAGDDNVLKGNRVHDNLEDGLDIKEGSQTLIGNIVYDNNNNAVLAHQQADTITLIGNDLGTKDDANALDLSGGARAISEGNRYQGVDSYTIDLQGSAGNHSTFTNDLIVDGGKKASTSINIEGGRGHVFENVDFVMRNDGYVFALRSGAEDIVVKDSGFYTDGEVFKPTGNDDVQLQNVANHAVSAAANILAGWLPGDGVDPNPIPDDDIPVDPDPDPGQTPDPDDQTPDDETPGGPIAQPGDEQDPGRTIVAGTDGRDHLKGGAGDHHLQGGGGHDYLRGGAGNDLIDGGADWDRLWGGEGQDTFVIRQGEAHQDRIWDFAAGEDMIRLEGYGPGASLSHLKNDLWKVDDGNGQSELFLITDTAHMTDGTDYLFS